MSRRGFTLIELMITTVIIGILVLISIPKFHKIREKAYVAAMVSDLGNLKIAEEAYFVDNMEYTDDVTSLGFLPSTNNSVFITSAPSGWMARSAHLKTAIECVVFVGRGITPPPNVITEGVVACQ